MYVRTLSAFAVAVIMITSGAIVYLQAELSSSTSPIPPLSDLNAGTHITITNNDVKMLGGGAIINFRNNGYYAVEYNLDLHNYSIVTGKWISTGRSTVWVSGNGASMELPYPSVTRGSLNMTLVPGKYTLIFGGHPGDVISITDDIAIRSYVPHQIGNFSIPSGTHIYSATTYHFHLNLPGEMAGAFTTPHGVYSINLRSSNGLGFSSNCMNSSAKPDTTTMSLGPNMVVYGPGYYNLSFSAGFYINQTLEFLYYYGD